MGGGEDPSKWQITLLVLDGSILNWLIEIKFLGELKLQLYQVLNLILVSWPFKSTSNAILGLQGFFFKYLEM